MIRRAFTGRIKPALLPVILLCLVMTSAARADVTWPDLLADPDNVALNRQFVSERLAKGDLPAALSAVERLINLRPTDLPARLLRAEILVNLANDTLARGELEALAKLPLRAVQKARVARLQETIESRSRRWRTAASLSFGLRGSDNANNYPSTGLMDFQLITTSPASTRQFESFGGAKKTVREVASTAGTAVFATYELPNQDRDTLTAGISHAEARGRKYEFLTSSTTTAFASASLRIGVISIQPSLRFTETHGKTDPASTIGTGSLTAGYQLPFRTNSYVNAEYSIVNRIPSTKFSTVNQNDGHSRSFRIGLSRSILPPLTIFGETSYTAFNPMENRFRAATIAYMQSKANQNHRQTTTIGLLVAATPNVRLRLSVDASDSKFDNQDPTSKKFRRDTQTRTSIGVQIAGQTVAQKLEKFTLGISASTNRNASNIKQHDYKRSDAAITVNYRLAD